MPKLSFDGAQITIPCPKCGHETKGKIGGFKAKGEFVCAGCGVAIAPDFAKFDQQIQAVEKQARKALAIR